MYLGKLAGHVVSSTDRAIKITNNLQPLEDADIVVLKIHT